ncbi:hypothetical protein ES288_D10G264300v1 [Gossypium darwinii]|uniref:Uncharacterized protein n=2 Tax=Gossypium TaxID=3633 RepID=A0A0D2UXP0_GOSRA|nr:hypothetical protein B456_011G244100 [Gossypium raimondii]KJB73695.1 hypothetical protein B456_011G244100 [Gossypium raimondii]TYG51525.1 hypothetical protein ES288_D10G264300v1 [Gossypium darwinii]TYG51526.1 hypothetical protein ES288_D10G264300v1 [Gossypium darwinii]
MALGPFYDSIESLGDTCSQQQTKPPLKSLWFLTRLLIMYHSCFQSSVSTTILFVCPWSCYNYMVMDDLMARQTYVHNFWYHFPQLVQNPECHWYGSG